VATYPEFFSGLASLTRRTAITFETAGLDEPFEAASAASSLLKMLNAARDMTYKDLFSGKFEQLHRFKSRFYRKHEPEVKEVRTGDPWKKLDEDIQKLAERCAVDGQANEADTETLRMFYECRQDIVPLLKDFIPVCDRLDELARKSLAGQTLSEADGKWIRDYGVTLARFHFYYDNSYEVPRDDFPIVTRVFSNPLTGSMLYAGLARPQALYVIASDGKTDQLYRGAVLSYREFVRSNDKLLDDNSWREMVGKGQTPPAPPFTRSFYAETSVPDLIKKLRTQSDYHDIDEILWQINFRATPKDLPTLLKAMTTGDSSGVGYSVEGMADIIAQLPWDHYQKDLIALLASKNIGLADAAARILVERPESLDQAALISGFDQQPTRTRRLYCALLSRLPQQTDATRDLLLKALRHPSDGVRWQAALAIATARWNDARSTSALLASLNDTNQFVGAAAAYALADLQADSAASALLAKLQSCVQSAGSPSEVIRRQASAVVMDICSSANRAGEYELLDPDHLEMRISMTVPEQVKQRKSMRLPPGPFNFPIREYSIVDALIEALGDLGYASAADYLFQLRGTDYDTSVITALAKIAPDRLAAELLATARNKEIDSYLREQALSTLCRASLTNAVRDLAPLLDDTTPIAYSRSLPGPEWRICDRAALTIATLLHWEHPIMLTSYDPAIREQLMKRAQEWAKSTR
jgi:hypothetical protein